MTRAHSDQFVLKPYDVSVEGYGTQTIYARSRGKALADAWSSDVFNNQPFGYFLKFARAQKGRMPNRLYGREITACGEPAFYIGHNAQYVRIVRPGSDVILSCHPYDIEPVAMRPTSYGGALT